MARLSYRLAAVWFADLVQFSRMAASDEEAALELVGHLQAAAHEIAGRHEGRIVKFTGDGVLAEFTSAEAAVRAALSLRGSYRARSRVTAEGPGDLRIGVHLGELATAPDGDVYGDGVNIAARIQCEALPGEVLVSEDLWRTLRGRQGLRFGASRDRELEGVGAMGVRMVDLQDVAADSPHPSALEASPIRWSGASATATNGPRAGPGIGQPSSAAAAKSLAVLPFVNMSPDPENEYFSDGMTEELILALSKVPELRVAARTSSFAFKDRSADVREIGERLGVAYVVEGSVRKAALRLRITAQLVEVSGRYHVWSESFDRQLEDVFAIQDEISRAIVEALKVRLVGPAAESLAHRGTADAEAYTCYLKGRFYLNKRKRDLYRKAIEWFERAIALDPRYALAYSGLADSWLLLERYGVVVPREAIPPARAAAQKAVDLDGSLAATHTSLGYLRMLGDWDWSGASAEFRRAIALDPRYAQAHHWYGWHLMQTARLDEALEELRCALALEPLSLICAANLGTVLYMMRRYEEAAEQLRRTLELDGGFVVAHQWLGRVLQQLGAHEEAIAAHRQALELLGGEDPESLASVGHVCALAGYREEGLRTLERLESMAGRQFISGYWLALVRLGLGDGEGALQGLRQAFEERFDWVLFVNVDPIFDPLRSHPGFQELVRSMNLEPR